MTTQEICELAKQVDWTDLKQIPNRLNYCCKGILQLIGTTKGGKKLLLHLHVVTEIPIQSIGDEEYLRISKENMIPFFETEIKDCLSRRRGYFGYKGRFMITTLRKRGYKEDGMLEGY
jgi:hypothetical protein